MTDDERTPLASKIPRQHTGIYKTGIKIDYLLVKGNAPQQELKMSVHT